MRAVIPAAGIGERLRPHTLNVPKVMIRLAGKPLIGHILDALQVSGVTSISVIVGYKHKMVENYIDEDFSHLKPSYPYQGERKGLGHAVLQGLEDKEESVLIVLGDTIFDLDLDAFVKNDHHAMAVVSVEDPKRFGIAEVDANQTIERLVEKPDEPKSDLALAGMYFIKDQRLLKQALEQLIEQDIKTRGEYQLTDALQIMIDQGEKMQAVKINGWYDCGTTESLLDSHRFLLKQTVSEEQQKSSIIHPPVYIHPDAQILNSVIGPHVTVGSGTRVSRAVLSETILGRDSVIENVSLNNSIIGNAAVINGRAEVNLGDNSELEIN